MITLRKLPSRLEKRLVSTAREHGWSLSQTVIRLLEEQVAQGAPLSSPRPDALDLLAGTWSAEEAEEFDCIVLGSRQIDPELWE